MYNSGEILAVEVQEGLISRLEDEGVVVVKTENLSRYSHSRRIDNTERHIPQLGTVNFFVDTDTDLITYLPDAVRGLGQCENVTCLPSYLTSDGV